MLLSILIITICKYILIHLFSPHFTGMLSQQRISIESEQTNESGDGDTVSHLNATVFTFDFIDFSLKGGTNCRKFYNAQSYCCDSEKNQFLFFHRLFYLINKYTYLTHFHNNLSSYIFNNSLIL